MHEWCVSRSHYLHIERHGTTLLNTLLRVLQRNLSFWISKSTVQTGDWHLRFFAINCHYFESLLMATVAAVQLRCLTVFCEIHSTLYAYLMFPLLVLYLMWSQIASNIPLVVVTPRQSKTWNERKPSSQIARFQIIPRNIIHIPSRPVNPTHHKNRVPTPGSSSATLAKPVLPVFG